MWESSTAVSALIEEAASAGASACRFAFFAILAALDGTTLLLFLADRLLGVPLPGGARLRSSSSMTAPS